jgi:protein-disulfide isomerase
MHQQLMDHPHQLGVISLKLHAREAGVVNKRFLEQLINSDFGWYVQDDIRAGIALGVQDIPALFINGKRVDKPFTTTSLNRMIRVILTNSGGLSFEGEERAAA